MIVLLCILLCSSFEFTGHVTPLSLLQKNVWPCVRKRWSEEDGQEDNNWEEGRTHMDHIVSEIHMVIRGVHVAWLTSLPVLDTWTLPFWKTVCWQISKPKNLHSFVFNRKSSSGKLTEQLAVCWSLHHRACFPLHGPGTKIKTFLSKIQW